MILKDICISKIVIPTNLWYSSMSSR